jgi:cation transporter-like permease
VKALFYDGDRSLSRVWRFLSIVLIFLLLWPPIFGITGWWMKFDFGMPLVGWLVAIAIYSYLLCAPSALVVGLIHAIAAIRFRQNSVLVPIVTAGFGALITSAVPTLLLGSLKDIFRVPTESYVIFLFASLMASLICWRITRRFARSP